MCRPRSRVLACASPAFRNADDLLHVDMDELTRSLALGAVHRSGVRGAVTAVQTGEAFGAQYVLHGRRCETELLADVVRSPTVLVGEPHDVAAKPTGCPVR